MSIRIYYRPQRSCGLGNVFTDVCLSTGRGRVSASVHAEMSYPPPDQADPPRPGRHPRNQADTPRDLADPPRTRQTPPQDQADPPGTWQTPPQNADSSIQSTSGRYASYWNAFLFKKFIQNILSITRLIFFSARSEFSSCRILVTDSFSLGGIIGRGCVPGPLKTPLIVYNIRFFI